MNETQLKELESDYAYMLNRGEIEIAKRKVDIIYDQLCKMYDSAENDDQKIEMCFELDRVAFRGRLLESLRLGSFIKDVTLFETDKELFSGDIQLNALGGENGN